MRIAFMINGLSGGGAERATVNLTNGLTKESDKELFVFTMKQKSDEYLLAECVKRVDFLTGNLLKDVLLTRRFLKEYNIDVVIGMSIYANLCLCAANVFLHAKVVISERNAPKYDHISWKTRFLRWVLYRNADRYVFQTQEARNYYSRSIQNRGVVIHNPVRTDIPYRTGNKKNEIIAVGRLMPQKNYMVLLKAFAKVHKQYPDYVLRIFGQGKELQSLEDLCKLLKLENAVFFEGFCLEVHEEIKDSNIFVLSSDFEGMPNSLMEAMAMGFPVISTDCPAGGPRELISNKSNGILVPVGDDERICESIIELIENDELRESLANGARNIRDTHCIEVVVEEWKALIIQLMKG